MSDDIAVTLVWSATQERELHSAVDASLASARETRDGITSVKARLRELGIRLPPAGPTEPHARPPVEQAEPLSWDMMRERAAANLRARGVDPTTVKYDDLLDAEEIRSIRKMLSSGFTIEATLDRYDILVSIAAGLCAALVDFFVVRVPTDITYLGSQIQEGSPLTKWMRSFQVPSDNGLAQQFKTSFDEVAGINIPGFGSRTHRLLTPGHDPLLGLVLGTIDILRGGMTAVSPDGAVSFLSGTDQPVANLFAALFTEIGHLLSDVATKMGLPVPGWFLTQFLQFGSFGSKDRTVADLARFMYMKGYDTRHFLTMATSVAAAEVVLRGYFGLRRYLDPEYDASVTRVGEVAGARRVGENPRFLAMSLAAHGIACAANAGKVAVYSGNPLAINLTQWAVFLQRLFVWCSLKLRSPSDVLMAYGRANERLLMDHRWPWLSATDADFPTPS